MRLQIEIPDDKMREIESMMAQSGTRTKAEFLNAAFTLFGWAVREKKAGRIIASVDEKKDSYKELSMPMLDAVRA